MAESLSPWQREMLLQRAVDDGYERLDADMTALLAEWEAVRAAYARYHGSTGARDFDAAQSGEWELLQTSSESLLTAIDEMLRDTYTRLPFRLSLLRGKVSGFALAVAAARRRRRAVALSGTPARRG
jgi:hypothetical protein